MSKNDPDRFRASGDSKQRLAWPKGDRDGALAMVSQAFNLDLNTEEGRTKADEYLALADPDTVFGPDMAKRIRANNRVKAAIAQAHKENEDEERRSQLQEKEDQEKREQTARILAMSYEAERVELTQKRGLPEMIDCNEHDPQILKAWLESCRLAAKAHLAGRTK